MHYLPFICLAIYLNGLGVFQTYHILKRKKDESHPIYGTTSWLYFIIGIPALIGGMYYAIEKPASDLALWLLILIPGALALTIAMVITRRNKKLLNR